MDKSKDALCIKFAQLTGTASATDMTLTGAATEDAIIMCWGLQDNTTADPVDYTSYASITGAGAMQTSTSTAGYKLAVLWLDNSA